MASSLPARLAAALAVPFVPWFSRDPTALRAHAGRLAAPAQLEAWGRRHRDPARPLVWLHAASVGEGLQARAILNALRTIQPNIQAVYTHFSPSAEQFATTVAADLTCYIPYDRSDDMARAVSGLRPDLVAFVKVDVWPVLATTAVDRLARVAIVAGTVDPKSARLRWPARAVARPGYAAADAVGAISQSDAERLARNA